MRLNRLFIFVIVISSLLWIVGCSTNTNKEVLVEKDDFPPIMLGLIEIDDNEYEIQRGGYRWERKIGLQTQIVQTDHASPFQMAKNMDSIILKPDQIVTINIEENPQLYIYLWNENGRDKRINHSTNQIKVPSNEGKYIYEVLAKWSNGEASYTFVIEIQ